MYYCSENLEGKKPYVVLSLFANYREYKPAYKISLLRVQLP